MVSRSDSTQTNTRGDNMKTLAFMVLGLFGVCLMLMGSMAFGAGIEWDRNTEPDMSKYNVKGCDTGASCTIDETVNLGSVPQTIVGVKPSFTLPAGKEGKRAVTAVDTAGNESGLSNIINFDAASPANPTGLIKR